MAEKYQKITVGGMLVRDGKVLIVRRSSSEEFYPGHYELPGGKVDFGEHPKASLAREFSEETGLKIAAGHIFNVFTYTSDADNRHTVELVYTATLDQDGANVKLSKEHDDYKWVSKEELGDYHMSEAMKKNIKLGFESL